MTKITEEINEIIQKNLPAQTAGVMANFIKEAEQKSHVLSVVEKNLKKMTEDRDNLQQNIDRMRKEWAELEQLNSRREEIAKLNEALRIREYNLELKITQIRLEESEKRISVSERLVEKVFGHPSVSVSTSTSKPIMVDNGVGATPYQAGSTYEDTTETTTQGKV